MLQQDATTGLFTRVGRMGIYSVWWRLMVSAIMALPFLLGGGFSLTLSDFPAWAALVVLALGAALTLGGLYLSIMAKWPQPSLTPNENTMVARHPTMKPAYARMITSIPLFVGAGFLTGLTTVPYVYPFVLFIAGLFLFFRGVIRYWVNHHTAYYVTNRRAMHIYRFAWLNSIEIPVSRIISISEARSFFEMLTGRGSVVVGSGFGARHNIRMQDMDDPGPVAEAIRGMLP